jgi:hypothetical protein
VRQIHSSHPAAAEFALKPVVVADGIGECRRESSHGTR